LPLDNDTAARSFESAPPPDSRDDRTSLAFAAGMIAAAVGGGIWALIVKLTGYELGIVAWGLGVVVGLAMAHTTLNRSRTLAVTAGGMALFGLVVGKVLIFSSSAGPIADELNANDETMRNTVAWMMYEERGLDSASLAEIDAMTEDDTLSDAAWTRMTDQAQTRLAAMSADERREVARNTADSYLRRVGVVDGIVSQASAFDLLWVLLAIASAYRPMLPEKEGEPAELQTV
jgi:hypothetical protein